MIANNKFAFALVVLSLFSFTLLGQVHHTVRNTDAVESVEDKQDRLDAKCAQYVERVGSTLVEMELPALLEEQKQSIADLYGVYLQSISRIDQSVSINHRQRTSSKARLTQSLNNDLEEILTEEQAKYLDREFRQKWKEEQAAAKAPKPPEPAAPTSGQMAKVDLLELDTAIDGAGLAPLAKGKKNQLKNHLLQRHMDISRQDSAELTGSILNDINRKFVKAIQNFLETEYVTVIEQAMSL